MFPRPRLDPVVEKMLFGVNAYGNVNMRTNENIRAIMGDANGTFRFYFRQERILIADDQANCRIDVRSRDVYERRIWQGDTYFPLDNIAEKNGKKMEVPKSH